VGTVKRERQKANRAQRLLALERAQRKRRRNQTWLRGVLFIGIGAAVAVLISYLTFGRGDKGSSSSTETTATPTTLELTTETTIPPTTFPPPTTVPGATITGDTTCPAADGSSPRTITFAKAPPMCIDVSKTYTAKISTNKGDVTVALDPTKAPQSVNNFVVLARYHYFDSTVCHRIIESFVVQCGDPTGTGSGPNPGYSIPDELPTSPYAIGDVAMANQGSPNTGGSQFFIISGAQGAALPQQYSDFGKVTEGLDTTVKALDALHGPAAAADGSDAGGVPTAEQVVISTVTITES
jgi:cyclophilin family peptidyl-prolyl cis-trans isomerase